MNATIHDIEPTTVEIGGEAVPVRVRSSSKARTSRILVGPRRPLEIIVPDGTPGIEIDELLSSRSQWIASKLAASDRVASRPHTLSLQRDGVVWLDGNPIPARAEASAARSGARLRDGALIVPSDKTAAGVAVENWYRREARSRAVRLVEHHARRTRLEPATISIRDPKTRWGSCSAKGNLGFSWRLVMAPPEVFDYVVVHELSHLRIPNHARSFWRLLDSAYPGWREPAMWLSTHGAEMRDYRFALA